MKVDPASIPPRMKNLPRDKRGYPIPAVVMRDKNGDPHFTINDTQKALSLMMTGQCAICAGHLGTHKWFVGGPGSAFHQHGRYIDGPVHKECGEFALKVCPYLALAGTYGRRLDDRTLKADATPDGLVLQDRTMFPAQPKVFVFADTTRFGVTDQLHIVPERPWKAVEFWRDGTRITAEDARSILQNDPNPDVPFSQIQHWWPST